MTIFNHNKKKIKEQIYKKKNIKEFEDIIYILTAETEKKYYKE